MNKNSEIPLFDFDSVIFADDETRLRLSTEYADAMYNYVLCRMKQENKQKVQNKIKIVIGILVVVLTVAIIAICIIGTSHTRVSQFSSSSAITASEARYIGNETSKKFHRKSCQHLPEQSNQIYYSTKEQAFKDGMEPCKICKP